MAIHPLSLLASLRPAGPARRPQRRPAGQCPRRYPDHPDGIPPGDRPERARPGRGLRRRARRRRQRIPEDHRGGSPPDGVSGLSQPTLDALVTAGRARGLRTVAHASSTVAERMALDAGVDVLTHAPVDADLPAELIQRALTQHTVIIPTLTMMETVVASVPPRPGGGLRPLQGHRRRAVPTRRARARGNRREHRTRVPDAGPPRDLPAPRTRAARRGRVDPGGRRPRGHRRARTDLRAR